MARKQQRIAPRGSFCGGGVKRSEPADVLTGDASPVDQEPSYGDDDTGRPHVRGAVEGQEEEETVEQGQQRPQQGRQGPQKVQGQGEGEEEEGSGIRLRQQGSRPVSSGRVISGQPSTSKPEDRGDRPDKRTGQRFTSSSVSRPTGTPDDNEGEDDEDDEAEEDSDGEEAAVAPAEPLPQPRRRKKRKPVAKKKVEPFRPACWRFR